MQRQFIIILFTLFSMVSFVRAQSVNKNSTISKVDSIKFKLMQEQLAGCWKTKYYQFKYDQESNLGCEYKSRVHSSAPVFNLKIVGNELFIEWIELTGGESVQKILRIKKKRLSVVNKSGKKVVYRRNKNCS